MPLGDTGVRIRFVAALKPGLLQSELITGERHFQHAFPDEHGFRFFLLDAPPGREADVSARLGSSLSDFGFDVTEAAARLNAYHRVENTYIATFQTLGALEGRLALRDALPRGRVHQADVAHTATWERVGATWGCRSASVGGGAGR